MKVRKVPHSFLQELDSYDVKLDGVYFKEEPERYHSLDSMPVSTVTNDALFAIKNEDSRSMTFEIIPVSQIALLRLTVQKDRKPDKS